MSGVRAPHRAPVNQNEIETAILAIQERNRRVEADKAWETSITRKLVITLITYAVVLFVLLTTNAPHPYMSALIPAGAFFLSTLSFPWFKKWWIESRDRKKRV